MKLITSAAFLLVGLTFAATSPAQTFEKLWSVTGVKDQWAVRGWRTYRPAVDLGDVNRDGVSDILVVLVVKTSKWVVGTCQRF